MDEQTVVVSISRPNLGPGVAPANWPFVVLTQSGDDAPTVIRTADQSIANDPAITAADGD